MRRVAAFLALLAVLLAGGVQPADAQIKAPGRVVGTGLKFGQSTAPTYLADTLSVTASPIYSDARLLRGAYVGPSMRVRRASDNAEQDIGFVGGLLDEASLTTFCSATNCFIRTRYDQSAAGNNRVQATASQQPQIVSAGAVIKRGGRPAGLGINASNTQMTFVVALSPTVLAAAAVFEDDGSAVIRGLFGTSSAISWRLEANNKMVVNRAFTANIITTSNAASAGGLHSAAMDTQVASGTTRADLDGVSTTVVSTPGYTGTQNNTDAEGTGSVFRGGLPELLFSASKWSSADYAAILASHQAFYGTP